MVVVDMVHIVVAVVMMVVVDIVDLVPMLDLVLALVLVLVIAIWWVDHIVDMLVPANCKHCIVHQNVIHHHN